MVAEAVSTLGLALEIATRVYPGPGRPAVHLLWCEPHSFGLVSILTCCPASSRAAPALRPAMCCSPVCGAGGRGHPGQVDGKGHGAALLPRHPNALLRWAAEVLLALPVLRPLSWLRRLSTSSLGSAPAAAAATNNVGDVAAKEEVWEVAAQVRTARVVCTEMPLLLLLALLLRSCTLPLGPALLLSMPAPCPTCADAGAGIQRGAADPAGGH